MSSNKILSHIQSSAWQEMPPIVPSSVIPVLIQLITCVLSAAGGIFPGIKAKVDDRYLIFLHV